MIRTTRPALVLLLVGATAKDIVHDAEQRILQEQHGDAWSREDGAIDDVLRALAEKHGKRPNLIHIMWDDTSLGEVTHPRAPACREASSASKLGSHPLDLALAPLARMASIARDPPAGDRHPVAPPSDSSDLYVASASTTSSCSMSAICSGFS